MSMFKIASYVRTQKRGDLQVKVSLKLAKFCSGDTRTPKGKTYKRSGNGFIPTNALRFKCLT